MNQPTSPRPRQGRSLRGPQAPPRRSFLPIALTIGAVLVLGAIVALLLNTGGTATGALNERKIDNLGIADATAGPQHIEPKPVQYSTNPPAGGDHWSQTISWGIHTTELPDERIVHNLEHGGVVVWYDPAKVDAATVDKMKSLVTSLGTRNPRVILMPRSKGIENGKPIAVTAWGYLMTLDTYDEALIRAFYNAHIAQGPECVQGQCPS